jgi:hypothetical protein
MKVLERAAGHACGPYRWQALDIETIAVRTNNLVCGAFRGFGANQAQFAMEGVLDRLAEQVGISGWEMRKRNVIRPGDEWGPGQIMDDGAGGAEACLDRIKASYDDAIAAGKAVGLGLGLKNSGPRQRLPRGVQGGRAVPGAGRRRAGPHRGASRLDRDGPGRPHRRAAGRRAGVGRRARPHRRDRRHHPRARLRPDDRLARHADGRRIGERRLPRPRWRAAARSTSTTRASTSSTGPRSSAIRRCQPDDPRRVQLRRADGDRRPGVRRHREGRRRARRRQGGQPDAGRGPGRGVGAHGARLRALRGLPDRPGDGLPDEHDPAVARHPARQGRPRDRGAPRRGAPAALAVRHQGRRRDRPRPDRSGGRRRAPRRRRRVAHHPPHAPSHP